MIGLNNVPVIKGSRTQQEYGKEAQIKFHKGQCGHRGTGKSPWQECAKHAEACHSLACQCDKHAYVT